MMILFLLSCLAQKTTLTGVVDHVGKDNCAVELDTGELVLLKSKICNITREGDKIIFYVRKK